MSIPGDTTSKIMEVLLDCLADENVEVRDMASKMLSGVVRCSQRHSILSLKVSHSTIAIAIGHLKRHVGSFPSVCEEGEVAQSTRSCVRGIAAHATFLHTGTLRIDRQLPLLSGALDAASDRWCVLLYHFLQRTHDRCVVLAMHATDPAPISTTIRKCASEFKKVGFMSCSHRGNNSLDRILAQTHQVCVVQT